MVAGSFMLLNRETTSEPYWAKSNVMMPLLLDVGLRLGFQFWLDAVRRSGDVGKGGTNAKVGKEAAREKNTNNDCNQQARCISLVTTVLLTIRNWFLPLFLDVQTWFVGSTVV